MGLQWLGNGPGVCNPQEACSGGKSLHDPSRIPHHARDGEREREKGRTAIINQPNLTQPQFLLPPDMYLMPPLVGASGNSSGGWWAKWRRDTIMLRSMFIGCLFSSFFLSLSLFC
jgi:hypothetical protein